MILRSRTCLHALALILLGALPAAAQICTPAATTALTVVGVAADDPLNIRSGPSASTPIVASVIAGSTVRATGKSAWAAGQCTTTCSGEEGGLNDRGRAIAYDCKARGKIWYQVKNRKGQIGWATAKYLDPGVAPPPPPKPEIETRLTYACGASGKLTVAIHKGGAKAEVTIARKTYVLDRRDHLVLRYSYSGADGTRLRGGSRLIEWRWPNGSRVTCSAN